MFFNRRQSDFTLLSSPQNFHQFAKIQFLVKSGDITMTTINKKLRNRFNLSFARSRPATENPTPGT